jgi:hypothetical protein
MIFATENERVRQHILTELQVDVANPSRERFYVEARSLYYVILQELTPRQSFDKIGKSVHKDHATVLHGIKQYESFCFYNKKLEPTRTKIISLYNSAEDIHRVDGIDKEIKRLKRMIKELKAQKERIIEKAQNIKEIYSDENI